MKLPAILRRGDVQRDGIAPISFDTWLSYFKFGGTVGMFGDQFLFYGPNRNQETPDSSFASMATQLYKANSAIYTCMAVRQSLFTEARFQFRQIRNGRPGDLFGNQELEILEVPWPNGTTGDLLGRMIQDIDLAGNSYIFRDGDRLRMPRPDWITIVLGSQRLPDDPAAAVDAEIIGYLYHPGGKNSTHDPTLIMPEFMAHFAPKRDPMARYRGMSWLTPVIREVMADQAMTDHKRKFLENGATPNFAVTIPEQDPNAFQRWVEMFKEEHQGVANAYKTLYLGTGMDVTPIGANLRQIDFKAVQGAGETRIAAAAEVPPVILSFSEGLASATYSNYELALRRFVDLTMRPLWRNAAASLAPLIAVPGNAELWYDSRDIAALAEDGTQQAQMDQMRTEMIHTLIAAGFKPDSVLETIAPDWTGLQHSGLYSVQLQPAGNVTQGKGAVTVGSVVPADMNGSGAEPAPATT